MTAQYSRRVLTWKADEKIAAIVNIVGGRVLWISWVPSSLESEGLISELRQRGIPHRVESEDLGPIVLTEWDLRDIRDIVQGYLCEGTTLNELTNYWVVGEGENEVANLVLNRSSQELVLTVHSNDMGGVQEQIAGLEQTGYVWLNKDGAHTGVYRLRKSHNFNCATIDLPKIVDGWLPNATRHSVR